MNFKFFFILSLEFLLKKMLLYEMTIGFLAAYAGSCKDASVTSNNNGEYEITFKYAECDTSAQQIYEKDVRNDIVISNTMNGNSEGLYAHGIRTTSALSLDVQCVYPAEITIDLDLSVEDALFEAEDAGEDGTVSFHYF